MDPNFDNASLIGAYERKLLQAVDVLEHVRDHLRAPAEEAHDALRSQALQAQRRSRELIGDAARLIALAEQFVAEARAIRAEPDCATAMEPSVRESSGITRCLSSRARVSASSPTGG